MGCKATLSSPTVALVCCRGRLVPGGAPAWLLCTCCTGPVPDSGCLMSSGSARRRCQAFQGKILAGRQGRCHSTMLLCTGQLDPVCSELHSLLQTWRSYFLCPEPSALIVGGCIVMSRCIETRCAVSLKSRGPLTSMCCRYCEGAHGTSTSSHLLDLLRIQHTGTQEDAMLELRD